METDASRTHLLRRELVCLQSYVGHTCTRGQTIGLTSNQLASGISQSGGLFRNISRTLTRCFSGSAAILMLESNHIIDLSRYLMWVFGAKMLDCDLVRTAMDQFASCERTTAGIKVGTQCLYPSFEPVEVFIVGHGDGFIVHDDGVAARTAWLHGAEDRTVHKALSSSARSFGCEVSGMQIRSGAPSHEWLWSAVAAVANASSDAARASLGKVHQTKEVSLIRKTKAILDTAKWHPETKLDFSYPGRSGKIHTFDLSVESNNKLALIDAVVPHPTSIAAKYLAFSDAENRPGLYKYALYDDDLAQEDKTLILNVADLIKFNAISGTDGSFLLQ